MAHKGWDIEATITDPGDCLLTLGAPDNNYSKLLTKPASTKTLLNAVKDGLSGYEKVTKAVKSVKNLTTKETVIDSTVRVDFPTKTYTAREYHPGPNSTEVIKRDTIWNK